MLRWFQLTCVYIYIYVNIHIYLKRWERVVNCSIRAIRRGLERTRGNSRFSVLGTFRAGLQVCIILDFSFQAGGGGVKEGGLVMCFSCRRFIDNVQARTDYCVAFISQDGWCDISLRRRRKLSQVHTRRGDG